MKRSKFLLLTLVAAMVLMGAGYAAWTQVFTINSTVSTGELFVDVVEGAATIDKYDGTQWNDDVTVDGLTNVVSSVDGSTSDSGNTTLRSITFTIGEMFPGTRANNTFTIKNEGNVNVKAVLSDPGYAISDGDAASELWHDLGFEVYVDNVFHSACGGEGTPKLVSLANIIKNAIGDIAVGEEKIITIKQTLPYSSGNDTENDEITWRVNLQFEQDNS